MRKIIAVIIILLAVITIAFNLMNSNEEIRVRIIPSDNSEEALEIKEKVKKEVIYFLQDKYSSNYDDYKNNILDNLIDFNKQIKAYNAIAYLKKHTFVKKTYNGNSVKDESVLTFLVEIGPHQGDNWWGVIYPKFLGIESTDKINYKSYILEKIKEWLGD